MAGEPTRNSRGQIVCGAKARNSPTGRCRSTALGPAGRCRMHNGWARRGPMHPSYRHGKFGKYEAGIRHFLNDPAALQFGRDAAALHARQVELLEQAGASTATVADIEAAWREFRAAAAVRDAARVQRAAERIDALLAEGRDQQRVWREFESLSLSKASLIERETKRIERAASVLSAAEA